MTNTEQTIGLNTILHVLGNFFRIHRILKGDKQATVSQAIGVSQGVLSQVEQGIYRALTISLVMRLLAYYGLEPGDLAEEVIERLHFSSVDTAESGN
ncbi:MAG: helix-turn-helix domain-containing protein [Taibaiella sp.]|nr:helix-turn-helix domain-containing protein [Taibaiella sp.]